MWVEKLFEAKVKPNTIRMRADRLEKKLCTNVHTEEPPEPDQPEEEDYEWEEQVHEDSPYSIGKELASWVEKLFEAKIPPRTIEQKARRIEEKNATSVASAITDTNNSEITNNQVGWGGKREGAGPPLKFSMKVKRVEPEKVFKGGGSQKSIRISLTFRKIND